MIDSDRGFKSTTWTQKLTSKVYFSKQGRVHKISVSEIIKSRLAKIENRGTLYVCEAPTLSLFLLTGKEANLHCRVTMNAYRFTFIHKTMSTYVNICFISFE